MEDRAWVARMAMHCQATDSGEFVTVATLIALATWASRGGR